MKSSRLQRRQSVAFAACVLAAAAAGCASTPSPTDDLAVASVAIERAERSGAEQAAPGELNGARDKLSRARSLAERDGAASARLAEQAEADAALAEARAEALRARNALATVKQGLEALREEANRSAPPEPPPPPSSSLPTPPPEGA